jgi:hypothetical protein
MSRHPDVILTIAKKAIRKANGLDILDVSMY